MHKGGFRRGLKIAGAVGVAAAIGGGSASAQTTALYGGGVTLSGKAYRNIFDYYGNTASGDLCYGLLLCPSTPYRSDVEILYLSVTSANAAKAYDGYNPSLFISGPKVPQNPPVASSRDFGPYYGTGTGSSWVPSSTDTDYFPTLTFASADPLQSSDITAVAALGFGPAVQMPSLSYSVVLDFTPTAKNWNPRNAIPAGGSSGVNISTDAFCGIFTGAVKEWSDPVFKAANKNVTLGSGKITVVYRHDGAATTFLMGNALLNQCGTTSHPVSKYPVPNEWLVANGIPNKPPYVANESFFINVFNAKHLPLNFYNKEAFSGQIGGVVTITGMQEAVDDTPGGIGYLSTDYAPPIQKGNDPLGRPIGAGVNLQSWASFSGGTTPLYFPPSRAHSNFIMQSATPPSFVGGASAPAVNPLSWSAIEPTPTNANAYPVGGFAYFDLYSCYASKAVVDALVGVTPDKLGLLRWFFGTQSENGGVPSTVLADEGFAPLPTSWVAAAKTLLIANHYTRIGTPKEANTACAKITKGA